MPPQERERCAPETEPGSWRDRINRVVARYGKPDPARAEREDELLARNCDPELLIRRREPGD